MSEVAVSNVSKGDFSVACTSKSLVTGNVLELAKTGGGVGLAGNLALQVEILECIQSIIRNRYSGTYTLAPIKDGLHLFSVPPGVTQTETVEAATLKDYLLKNTLYTDGDTTAENTALLADPAAVNLMKGIADRVFPIARNAVATITGTVDTDSDFVDSADNGRLNSKTENPVFTMAITVQ